MKFGRLFRLYWIPLLALIWVAMKVCAFAQGGMMPGPGTVHSTGGGGIVFTPTDAQSNAPGFGTHNYTIAIGTASADRIVVVGWQLNATGVITGPTINGGAMTYATGSGATNNNQQAIYYANVTTGTTATLAMPGGSSADAVVVGILTGQSGGGAATPTNTALYTTIQAQPIGPISLTVSASGIGILICGGNFGGITTPTFTWANTFSSAGDETAPGVGGSGGAQLSMSHVTATTTTATCSSSDALSFGGTMAGASWAP